MWTYNFNVDYSKYYNENVFLIREYQWFYQGEQKEEIPWSYGKLIDITKPRKETNYQCTIIIQLHNSHIICSTTSDMIKSIKIDKTETTKRNYKILQNYIVQKTNNDIYCRIYNYIKHDYIDI